MTSSNSKLVGDRMDVTCGRLYATYARFWQQPALETVVPAFFILMHQIVRASVPLMESARSLCVGRDADAVARPLSRYLAVHIGEERHHDDWLLDDLAAAGVPKDDVREAIPSRSVASLVGAQYYWVRHCHPVAIVGYMRVLEGNPPSDAHIDRLRHETLRAAGRAAARPPSAVDGSTRWCRRGSAGAVRDHGVRRRVLRGCPGDPPVVIAASEA